MDTRPKTIILDIDGCLIQHRGPQSECALASAKLLPGVLKCLDRWECEGTRLILLTGRKESMREQTLKELRKFGICFDLLIMGVGGGNRYLINDCKADGRKTAFAINISRDGGLVNVKL